MYRIFVINPGSTSTKLSLFEDEKNVWETKVFHEAHDIAKFKDTNDQLEYRFELILKCLADEGISLEGIDAIVGRGGGCASVKSGVFEINKLLVDDTRAIKSGAEHASMLGVQLAYKLNAIYGGRMFMLDPICVDEFTDVARMTGIKGVYRTPSSHALNQKGVAKFFARQNGKKYEDYNLIVAHIDGGITIGAHNHGKMIDCTLGAGGEGPYTPSRLGSVGLVDLLHYLKENDNIDEVLHMCVTGGGFSSLLGTNDSDAIYEAVKQGDPASVRAWEGMIYNIEKCIGSMAAVLKGNVDAILLTGGLMRFACISEQIRECCGWIAPIYEFPGEVEHEAMCEGALSVLRGEVEPYIYTGEPVFTGFKD